MQRVGPRLGGAAGGTPASGDAARPLRPGHTFAFDGFFGWPQEDGTTKTISVEEMAEEVGGIEMVYEAAGSAALSLRVVEAMACGRVVQLEPRTGAGGVYAGSRPWVPSVASAAPPGTAPVTPRRWRRTLARRRRP